MAKAVNFLAGMAQGYMQQSTVQRNQAREDERDRQQREEAEARREERERVKSERNRLADAYAPVGMQDVMTKPDTADNRDVGTPGTELTNTGAKRVGQQTFGPDQTKEAEAAVAAANTPEAQTARASKAMLSMGNVAGAQQLRTGARQEKLAGLQLDEAQQKHLNTMFDASLQPLASHDAIADMVSNSTLGGAMKIKAVPSADGKTVEYAVINPDGSMKPSGYSFPNDARGLLEAKSAMSRMVPVGQKLEYLHKQDQLRQQAARDAAQQAHQGAVLTETGRHNRVMEGVYGRQADAAVTRAERPAAGASVERMDEPDKVAVQNIEKERGRIDKRVGQIEDAILKAQADGMWDEASPNATALRQQLRQLQEGLGALRIRETTIMRKYQGAAPADPYGMRGPAAGAPVAGATKIPTATQAARDTDRVAILRSELAKATNPADRAALERELARAGAAPVATMGAPAAPAAAAPAPTAAPARPVASMADRIPGSGGVQAPPATAGAPTAAAAPAAAAPQGFQQFLAANISTPQGKAAILRRVRTELPQLQQAILADAQVLQNPNVSPEVKASLQARIAANQATAEMMQRFVDGNPGLVPA